MKLQQGLYYCEWCMIEFKQNVKRTEGSGRKGVGVDQCICPECFRYVSQKTKLELNA